MKRVIACGIRWVIRERIVGVDNNMYIYISLIFNKKRD